MTSLTSQNRLLCTFSHVCKCYRQLIPTESYSKNKYRFKSALAENKHQITMSTQTRFSPINIQMLSSGLHQQIFGENIDNNIDQKTLEKIILHLQQHNLWGAETSILPEVNFKIPQLHNSNISDHFHFIGSQLSDDYKNLLTKLVNCDLPPLPQTWEFSSGWVKYNLNGETKYVAFPEDPALVFDVEVCVQEGNFPTLAAAVSENNWYLWCSEKLIQNNYSLSKAISLSDLIPLESAAGQKAPSDSQTPKLIVGHNVAFDRTFVKEQYFLERTKTNFLDTMSLHICVSGLTGLQRSMSIASKKAASKSNATNIPLGWSDISSLNNLADVYSLYCEGKMLSKAERDIFVNGSLSDVREKFQELATYCARDAIATHQILKKVTPMFFERFPHPVTFCGLLEMASAYLPVNQNWERYLNDTQSTYEDLQKELKLSLVHLANDACSLLNDNMYKNDPWLWDLDWSTQSLKFRKEKPPPKTKRKKKDVLVESEVKQEATTSESISSDFREEVDIQDEVEVNQPKEVPTLKHIFETALSLRKVRPFLPGYPAWFRELCDKNYSEKDNWEPGPILISSQMRCVPKLMRLTWDGFPLHFDTKYGWGYLVPNISEFNSLENVQNFPLRNFLKLFRAKENNISAQDLDIDFIWNKIKEPREDKAEEAKFWQSISGKKYQKKQSSDGLDQHYGIEPHDIGLDGVLFYCLPHKDGPHKRVGNPLSKDFLSKVEDGTLRTWGKEQADRALLLSKMLSYWKNAHSRIQSQMVVWLNRDELPDTVIQNEHYEDSNMYGAILPRLIPAGTVTRRAVEPTWLTASNAYEDRVGSELKCMIQAPPGYHFVGADVDSEELWIAAIFGDSQFSKVHGCTAFGWMTLQGKKSIGTDMHSKTANSVGISRSQAKILNYARIYGAGKAFAQRLLMQFNHRLTPQEAKMKVKKIYAETKGSRRSQVGNEDLDDEDFEFSRANSNSKKIWVGGSESHMFNKLEEIAVSSKPCTPVLNCRISRALEPDAVDKNFMTSRVNWVVQSSAVDFLHLMLVCMKWLFKEYNIQGRFVICIHDEVRYLVKSEDRYRAAMALQITNLLTRSFFTYKVGMNDLPQSVAFFSSVDVDSVIRKEVNMDSATPSNPHGLEKGHGIPQGESLDIFQILQKTNEGMLSRDS